MTAAATFLIDGQTPAKGPSGVPGASGAFGADTGKPKFTEFLAATEAGKTGGAGEPQLASNGAAVEAGNQTTEGLDAALMPASPVALFEADAASHFALFSGGALGLPTGGAPMPLAIAAGLGANAQGQAQENGFILPVNLPQPSTAGTIPGNGAATPHAGAGAATGGALETALATIANLSNTVASGAVAGAKAGPQSLSATPVSQRQPETLATPGAPATQSVVAGLTVGTGTTDTQTAKNAASPQNANINAVALARIRVPNAAAPEVAQVAVSIPRPALTGDVAVAVAAATPSVQGTSTVTPNTGTGFNVGAGAIAAVAHSGQPSTAEAVLAALVAGAQTGGKSQDALIATQESLAASNGVSDLRADGSLPLTHQTIGKSPDPVETALRAGRDASVPQPPAEQVAMQLRAAAKNGIDRITIQLKPATLGAIDVKLDIGHDGRVVAVIAADRADTLELLQRDARELERALQDAGLSTDSGSLSFNLRGEGSYADAQADAQGSNEFDQRFSDDEPEVEVSNAMPPPVASDRALDIRV